MPLFNENYQQGFSHLGESKKKRRFLSRLISSRSEEKPKRASISSIHAISPTDNSHQLPKPQPMKASNTVSVASFGIDLNGEDIPIMARRSVSSAGDPGFIQGERGSWKPPDSWKVRMDSVTPSIINDNSSIAAPTMTPALSFSSISEVPASPSSEASDTKIKNNTNRRAHRELKGASRSSLRIFKGDMSSLLPCTLETSCKDILDTLKRKRFGKADDEYMLVVSCGGLTRSLSLDEKPLKIQRTLLFFYGYTERDNLDFIERTDLSFLFKFIVEEKGVELISEEKRRLISPHDVNLVNWNLQDIPNFLYAEPIVSLDVSQNPSFEFTKEFIHDCRNLTSLSFMRSGAPNFPTSIVHAPKLKKLKLEVNYIKSIPEDIEKLKYLEYLSLDCNKLYKLPDGFSKLASLQKLNLSSNRFKEIPQQICEIKTLRSLDLSYNNITTFPVSFAKLENLEVLQIAANKLMGELSSFFDELVNLVKIDVRFNKLTSVDALQKSPKLEVIRAAGNNISVFRSMAATLIEVELSMNPLTYVYFENEMPCLKLVDFSKGKLSSCSFVSHLVNVERLVLDQNHLSVLPEEINAMKNILSLSVFKNNLNTLPYSIGELGKLKYLDIHLNNVGRLPESIWKLKSLETFNASSNILEIFPDPPDVIDKEEEVELASGLHTHTHRRRRVSEISNGHRQALGLVQSLKALSISDNKLTDSCIPTLGLFKNLNRLNLAYNELFDIPTGHLSQLSKLKSLFLSGNNLSSLPVEDFENWPMLTLLYLNGNRFSSLPSELSKITSLESLDVGSNLLKYNIGNIPYDWNWCYNKNLKYLNFSGNKRLEIKPQHIKNKDGETLDSFLGLQKLKMLGLMDVTITTDAVPDQSVNVRVRSTVSQLGKFGYGISDTLGDTDFLKTRDVVLEKFRGNPDECLITIFDGKNSNPKGGDKISKIIQETFEIHLAEELKTMETIEGKTIEDCLRGAFLTMNSEMNILINKDESSTFSSAAVHRTKTTDKLTLEEDGLSGCCATIVYIRGDELYVANVGDTMGLLTRSNGEFKVITTKHEPYAPKEYERIRDSGGFVTTDGNLDAVADVSRAVGFFKLIPHINSKPSVYKFHLTQSEEMIAIGTSDIWSKVPYDLAADIIRQEKSNPEIAAEKLRDFAISYGCCENVTAVVLSLRQFSGQKKHHTGTQPEDTLLRKLDEEIEPPTGDLAMVFTDIKNSTLLWDNYPLAMRSAIKVHNAIMRRQLRIIGGYEVKTEGDAFVVSFPTPTSALLWCFAVQTQLLTTSEWPAEILNSDQGFEVRDNEGKLIYRGLSVRMGVHWGTPVCERDVVTKRMDYFGPMVNRASRVSSVADGGEVSMSTDFRTELLKVKKIYEESQKEMMGLNDATKKSKLTDVNYGYKGKGKDVEQQMAELMKFGIAEDHIGAKKLKGLETPENIWVVFPESLKARIKGQCNRDIKVKHSNQLIYSGVSSDSAWALRKISLRLEKICSYLSSDLTLIEDADDFKMNDFVRNESDKAFRQDWFSLEPLLMLFLDHCITRIENSVMMLSLRSSLSNDNIFLKGEPANIYSEMMSLVKEVQELRIKLEQKELEANKPVN
ncbi:adenylate cyclase [Martiniozyma asiatica (nom. inval.)]|nr:adenylate cyclase [Martiniozyma asiatica]